MTIRFLNQQQEPLIEAVVSIAQAPGSIQDIAMIADEEGAVSFEVIDSGKYVFSIYYDGQTSQVSANLTTQDAEMSLVIA